MPFPVIWEVTRAALHCGVKLDTLSLQDFAGWDDQGQLRKSLEASPSFHGKALPERCDDRAWKAAFSGFRWKGLGVTLALEANYNNEIDGPLYNLRLQPLKLDFSHRLDRRFGADRFLEFTIPSPAETNPPRGVNTEELVSLIPQSDHVFLGRIWRAFFMKDTKDVKKKKKHEAQSRPETQTLMQKKLYLFAVHGNDFSRDFTSSIRATMPRKEEATTTNRRTPMEISDLMKWAISISNEKNGKQLMVKLFSRLALSMAPC